MIKVHDKQLEEKLQGMNSEEVVAFLKKLQDGSGLKICMNVTKGDPKLVEV